MDLTSSVRDAVISAIQENGLTQAEVARRMGKPRQWFTAFKNGSMKSLDDFEIVALEEILGIKLADREIHLKEEVPRLAVELSEMAANSEDIAAALAALVKTWRSQDKGKVHEPETEPKSD